ncbi:OmpA family protein [Rhodobacteraceae bacterium]|nr:OmpA family protein [Paracoccaceae bacterium]
MAFSQTASAQDASAQAGNRIYASNVVPGIWTDPDGCEHWVIDDGIAGYMSPHLTRDGLPVCKRGNACGVLASDQFFATNQHTISAAGRQKLMEFFSTTKARAFSISGHTDSRASDAYNMALSQRRADSVAAIARAAGANVAEALGYGERKPRASNATSAGMAQNRRVEIFCIQ